MSPPERVLQVVSFLIIYISSVVYFFVAYDTSLLRKKDEDLSEDELYEKDLAILFGGQ